ncbi:hypothetical protein HMPREF9080_00432 [Cardiobacterium valvarum F0432]|uniref:Uncharacterized protein n=1 Tax=Cardiobacterium valvarum F0432 TaxID=797473 RepID=G9ZCF5_9GAMM|nr:hypothetical protein HMPREF9080_00432 [Cardiobacterium valvarum F0432]
MVCWRVQYFRRLAPSLSRMSKSRQRLFGGLKPPYASPVFTSLGGF